MTALAPELRTGATLTARTHVDEFSARRACEGAKPLRATAVHRTGAEKTPNRRLLTHERSQKLALRKCGAAAPRRIRETSRSLRHSRQLRKSHERRFDGGLQGKKGFYSDELNAFDTKVMDACQARVIAPFAFASTGDKTAERCLRSSSSQGLFLGFFRSAEMGAASVRRWAEKSKGKSRVGSILVGRSHRRIPPTA
jgi:hypothetical protein